MTGQRPTFLGFLVSDFGGDPRVMVTMKAESDQELLIQYHSQASDTAFKELVERYKGLVYGVAMRRLRERASAEEVTQNVFFILSR